MKIRDFIEAIQKAEYSDGNGPLELMIKYTWSPEILDHQFPLPKGNYITETGLKDPGFGPGPTLFSEIELIRIKTKTALQKEKKAYKEKVEFLKQLIAGFESVSIEDNYIEYNNKNT